MEIHFLKPSTIEGIGMVTEEKLFLSGVVYLSDFFRFSPQTLVERSSFSLETIEDWRSACAFLEIEGMSPNIAEALIREGIKSYDKFLFSSLENLQTIFRKAAQDRIISEEPSLELIYTISKRISRAKYGYIAQGRVIDEQGEPIEDARISISQYRTKTNENGYWRISGMNDFNPCRLFIKKSNYQRYFNPEFQLQNDPYLIDSSNQIMRLGEDEDLVWDEFKGDELPGLDSYNTSTKTLQFDDLRSGDILRVFRDKESQFKLLSIFSKMVNQTFTVLTFDVDKILLPGATLGEYWRYRDGTFFKTSIKRESVSNIKEMHRVNKSIPNAEEGENSMDYFSRSSQYLSTQS